MSAKYLHGKNKVVMPSEVKLEKKVDIFHEHCVKLGLHFIHKFNRPFDLFFKSIHGPIFKYYGPFSSCGPGTEAPATPFLIWPYITIL